MAPNGNVTIKVEALNVSSPGLAAANISLFYDHSVIQPTSCTLDSAFTGTCNTNINGEVQFNLLSTSGKQGDFDLVEMVFEAVGQADESRVLDINPSVFIHPNGSTISVTDQDGSVTIGQTLGDVSCDNQVTVVDALFILQYDVGIRGVDNSCPLADNTLLLANCDVNADNTCNSVDALFVLQCDVGISNVLCPARSPSSSSPSSSNQPTQGGENSTVEISSYEVEQSSTLTVPVRANIGNTALGAATIRVNFDPNLVQATQCQVPEALFGQCTFDNEAGQVSFNVLSASGVTNELTLANITFQGHSSGTTALNVEIQTFADTSGNALTVSDVDGEIIVTSSAQSDQLFLPLLLSKWGGSRTAPTCTPFDLSG